MSINESSSSLVDPAEQSQPGAKNHRGGRPRRAEPVRQVKIRIPEGRFREIEAAAEIQGLSISSFVLMRLSESRPQKVVPAINVEQWKKLQMLTEVLRSFKESLRDTEATSAEMFDELIELIRHVRLKLLDAGGE